MMTPERRAKVDSLVAAHQSPCRASCDLEYETEPPSVPGHYWCRFDDSDRPFIVDVVRRSMDKVLVDEEDGAEVLSDQFKGCEWAGPIPQPVEPKT